MTVTRITTTAGPPTPFKVSTIQAIPGPPGPQGPPGTPGGGAANYGLDLSGTDNNQQVVGLKSHVLPALTVGGLHWNGSAWFFNNSPEHVPHPLGPDSAWTAHYYIAAVSGNDSNNGTSSGTAFKTCRQLATVLSTLSPALSDSLTITFTESQPDASDMFVLNPIMLPGGKCYVEGVPTIIATGTLASVTAKSTSAADGRWRIDLGSGATGHLATPGLKLVNTSRSSSVAMVHDPISGTIVTTTQPYEEKSVASPGLASAEAVPRNDWAPGDSWALYQLPTVYVAQFQPTTVEGTATDLVFCFLQNVYVPDASGTPGNSDIVFGKGVTCIECYIDGYIVYPLTDTFSVTNAVNCIYAGGANFNLCFLVGGALGTARFNSVFLLNACGIDGDIILENVATTFQNNCLIGSVCVVGPGVIGLLGASSALASLSFSTPQMYGTYTFTVGGSHDTAQQGLGSFTYSTTAASFFKGVPTIQLDSVSVGIAEDLSHSPTIRYPNIGLTAAHIDLAIGSGGFGGVARGYNGSYIAPSSFSPGSPTPYITPVANGGTGQGSLTAHGVLIGEGTSAINSVALTSGQLLVGQGGDPQAHTVSGDATLSNTAVLTLANTAVTPGTYGDSTHVSQVTVDSKGRVTNAASVAVATATTGPTLRGSVGPTDIGGSNTLNTPSVSITVPSSGFLLITLQAHFQWVPTSGAGFVDFGINVDDSSAFAVSARQILLPSPDLDLTVGYWNGGITMRHAVTAGSHDVYMMSQSLANYGSDKMLASLDVAIAFTTT